MGVEFVQHGNFKNTERFLQNAKKLQIEQSLQRFAQAGVQALSSATPVESGQTAASWGYTISASRGSWTITWTNSHMNAGVNIAVILQYGHGTGTGGYVQGRDYINPVMRPIFDKIADDAWKAVTSL